MLRITVEQGERAQTIKLEGKVVGPWVEELNRTWHSLGPSLGSTELRLDLRSVSFVDGKGRELLREIYQRTNARFLVDSPLTKYFAEDAMRQSPKDGGEGE
jgi:hypothetical protein